MCNNNVSQSPEVNNSTDETTVTINGRPWRLYFDSGRTWHYRMQCITEPGRDLGWRSEAERQAHMDLWNNANAAVEAIEAHVSRRDADWLKARIIDAALTHNKAA